MMESSITKVTRALMMPSAMLAQISFTAVLTAAGRGPRVGAPP